MQDFTKEKWVRESIAEKTDRSQNDMIESQLMRRWWRFASRINLFPSQAQARVLYSPCDTYIVLYISIIVCVRLASHQPHHPANFPMNSSCLWVNSETTWCTQFATTSHALHPLPGKGLFIRRNDFQTIPRASSAYTISQCVLNKLTISRWVWILWGISIRITCYAW